MKTLLVKMLVSCTVLVLFGAFSVNSNEASICSEKEIRNLYLDSAADFLSKAKTDMTKCEPMPKFTDCLDVLQMDYKKSGIYEIWPKNRITQNKSIRVYCDMDTNEGGWTVIQRRGDFGGSNDIFNQDWQSYKEGFGEIDKDFWLGNDNIFALTTQRLYSVRFDMRAVDQSKKYALYDRFWIDDENNKYTLYVYDYTGDAGDSLMTYHRFQKFSTDGQDNDNDKYACADKFKGGWWYNNCQSCNLNGIYIKGNNTFEGEGMIWSSFKGHNESLEWSEIKIRPK